MKVVIILPTYNEKLNIKKLINHLQSTIFPRVKQHSMHILVADDFSPDGTAAAVHNLMRKWGNIHIIQGPKEGLGAAYMRSIRYAIEQIDAEILLHMDADGQHDPSKIPAFLAALDAGQDLVIGTRYSGGGSIPKNWPIQRKALSICANLFIRIILKHSIHDWTGGYRAFRKEVFLKIHKKIERFSGNVFLVSFLDMAVKNGFSITEIPFHFTDRFLGKSKITKFKYIMDVLSYVLKTPFNKKP